MAHRFAPFANRVRGETKEREEKGEKNLHRAGCEVRASMSCRPISPSKKEKEGKEKEKGGGVSVCSQSCC